MWLVRRMSPRARQALASWVASLAWALGVRRRVTLDNLRRALPSLGEAERRQVAKGAYRTMALAALEAVTSDLLSDEEVARVVGAVEWRGLDVLFASRAPVLIASAHLGSWELFAEVMARRGAALSAVARPLSGAFNEWIVRNRQAAGMEIILQRGALVGMLGALARGRAVVQLIDQALPSTSALWVPFFGQLASTTPALSIAALRTGVPVYVVVAVRQPSGLQVFVEGPFPVDKGLPRAEALEEHTARLTRVIEDFVRRYPEQWLWLHRRWKGCPPGGRADGEAQDDARRDRGAEPER